MNIRGSKQHLAGLERRVADAHFVNVAEPAVAVILALSIVHAITPAPERPAPLCVGDVGRAASIVGEPGVARRQRD